MVSISALNWYFIKPTQSKLPIILDARVNLIIISSENTKHKMSQCIQVCTRNVLQMHSSKYIPSALRVY